MRHKSCNKIPANDKLRCVAIFAGEIIQHSIELRSCTIDKCSRPTSPAAISKWNYTNARHLILMVCGIAKSSINVCNCTLTHSHFIPIHSPHSHIFTFFFLWSYCCSHSSKSLIWTKKRIVMKVNNQHISIVIIWFLLLMVSRVENECRRW